MDFEAAHGHPAANAAEVMAHLKQRLGYDGLATSGGKALADPATAAASAPMLQALNDDFGREHGRAPADVAELLGHMQGVAFDAAMAGGGGHVQLAESAGGAAASMPAPLMRALSDDFEAIYKLARTLTLTRTPAPNPTPNPTPNPNPTPTPTPMTCRPSTAGHPPLSTSASSCSQGWSTISTNPSAA